MRLCCIGTKRIWLLHLISSCCACVGWGVLWLMVGGWSLNGAKCNVFMVRLLLYSLVVLLMSLCLIGRLSLLIAFADIFELMVLCLVESWLCWCLWVEYWLDTS